MFCSHCGKEIQPVAAVAPPLVAAEQPFLPEFANALRGSSHVLDVRRNAAGGEQVADRLLESRGVKGVAARDADAG